MLYLILPCFRGFKEMRLLEMLYKSSWSIKPIYALTNYELFIPKADKAYF